MIADLYIVTRGGLLWYVSVTNQDVTVSKLTGSPRRVTGGSVGLTDNFGLVTYMSKTPREDPFNFRPATRQDWIYNSTPIVGVFVASQIAEESAKLVASLSYEAMKPWDTTMEQNTQTAIKLVGDNHPWITLDLAVAQKYLPPNQIWNPSTTAATPSVLTAFNYFGDINCPKCGRLYLDVAFQKAGTLHCCKSSYHVNVYKQA